MFQMCLLVISIASSLCKKTGAEQLAQAWPIQSHVVFLPTLLRLIYHYEFFANHPLTQLFSMFNNEIVHPVLNQNKIFCPILLTFLERNFNCSFYRVCVQNRNLCCCRQYLCAFQSQQLPTGCMTCME